MSIFLFFYFHFFFLKHTGKKKKNLFYLERKREEKKSFIATGKHAVSQAIVYSSHCDGQNVGNILIKIFFNDYVNDIRSAKQ